MTVSNADLPAWWCKRLFEKLQRQARVVSANDDWYEGRHPLPAANARNRSLFAPFQRMSRANYVAAVVDAVADRLWVNGLRVGTEEDDRFAWGLWQASALDSDQGLLMTSSLAGGIAYLSVWPEAPGGEPRFAPEHGAQVVHENVPGSLRKVAAALKVFPDEIAGDWVAELYTPDFIARWRAGSDQSFLFPGQLGDPVVEANPHKVVPIVPMPNQMNLRGEWFSEMRNGIRPQMRLNQSLLNLMVGQETVAFPQKWATGIEPETNPDGTPKRPFTSGADQLWVDENPEARFGQFQESRMDGYLAAEKRFVEEIASTTKTPLFAISDLAVPPSAEALTAMESGLVKKVEKRQRAFGECFEDAMRVALKMAGRTSDNGFRDMEVLWADPRVRSDAGLGDYLTKLQAIGVPTEALWKEAGATPVQIDEWRRMQLTDAFRQLIMQVGQQQQAERDQIAGAAPAEPARPVAVA